ncbi:MAG: sensor histidine kinase, partial [Planctomycetota bacterium]
MALPWLWRLRWLAVLGQTVTLLFVALALNVELPYAALGGVIAVTVITNLALTWAVRHPRPWGGLVPGVLCLDILLLTALLYLSGGPKNPFSFLYVVHVAMAAVNLSLPWTSLMVGLSAACYGLLFTAHVPLKVSQEEIGFPLYQA